MNKINYAKKINRLFIKIVILLFSIFIFLNYSYSVSNWYNISFEYRQEINITNVGSTTLTNYPIYLNLSYDTDMQSDFDDIIFTQGVCGNTSTSVLNYEIDNYSSSSNAYIWINVPSIPASGTQLCMYYSNSTMSSQENKEATWNSNYVAVWHFSDPGTGDREDSTSNTYNGSPRNYDGDEKVQGLIGLADSFDGLNDRIPIRDLNYNTVSLDEFSVCVWFKTGFSGASYSDNWAFIDYDRSEFFDFYIRGDTGALGFSTNSGGVNDQTGTIGGLNDDNWHYGCAVYDGTDKIIYTNGVETGRAVNAHGGSDIGDTTTRYGYIGDGSEASSFDGGGNNIYYDGEIDDIKYKSTAISSDWINQSYQMVTDQSNVVAYGVKEQYFPTLDVVITSPSTAVTYPISQNATFEYNITISCIGKTSSTCGNITIATQYNNTGSTFANITTTPGATPIWTTSLNPQNCVLNGGSSCNLSLILNVTGLANSIHTLRSYGVSNYSSIVTQFSTQNLTLEVIQGNVVQFNQSSYSFGTFDRLSGTRAQELSMISSIGNNSNIIVLCSSGDCSTITTNFTNGINLSESESSSIFFACSDTTTGTYSATYSLTSNEFNDTNTLSLTCNVDKIFGPIQAIINQPTQLVVNEVVANQTFTLNATIECRGDCGNITAYAIYSSNSVFGDGSDGDLTVTINNTIINDYAYLTGNQSSTNTTITINDATNFSAGDEILIIQVQNGSGYGTAGIYEFLTISSKSGNDLIIGSNLNNSYYSGVFDQSNATVTQVVRVPQYQDVTIQSSGSITSKTWDGYSGGIVVFRAQNTLNTSGYIDVNYKGFRGGTCGACSDGDWGTQGEGYLGLGWDSLNANGNGGGGGYGPSGSGGEPGAGGGYATAGTNGVGAFTSFGAGTIGDVNLSRIYLGGGAGAGGDNDGFTPFPQDIDGGGVAVIFAQEVIDARVRVNGERGFHSDSFGGTTGGGSGGSVWIATRSLDIQDVSASGGLSETSTSDGDTGGPGGDGRIRFDYLDVSGNSENPTAGFNGSYSDLVDAILTTFNTPLYTLSTQPQSCIVSEDGSCSFEWEINATGNLFELVNISVIAFSNFTTITPTTSNYTIVNISQEIVPVITLLTPGNNEKIITQGEVVFSFNILEDDNTINCTLYINDKINETFGCSTKQIFNYTINMSPGFYNFTLQVNDTDLNRINSSTRNFTIIKDYSTSIRKTLIGNIANIHTVNITVDNRLNTTQRVTIFDIVDSNFTPGSFAPVITGFSLINGIYSGTMYWWNTTLTHLDNRNIIYSIARNNNETKLVDNYVVGIE